MDWYTFSWRPPVANPDPNSASMHSFLALPAEIRNQIYLLVLTNSSIAPLQRLTTRNHLSSYLLPPLDLSPQLLSTCRQIHAEALPILYTRNTFCAHPSLLSKLPFLLSNTRPVVCAALAKRIRRWYVQVRLDADARFTYEDAKGAFSGAEELEVEVWQAMFASADLRVLRLFEGVRSVKRARVAGSVGPGYGRWLEKAMMSDVDCEVEESPVEEEWGIYDVWTHGNR